MRAPFAFTPAPSGPPPPRPPYVPFEAYYEAEQRAETRSEWIDGIVRTMPGGNANHLAVTSIFGELLGAKLRAGGACRFLDQNVQIPIPAHRLYTYPDGAIACPPAFAERQKGALLNPKAIFEVLSPSTEGYDRGAKFRMYRTLGTLEEYVLVSTREPVVEVFRAPVWGPKTYEGLDAIARLESVGLDLPLRDLYADVTFEDVL